MIDKHEAVRMLAIQFGEEGSIARVIPDLPAQIADQRARDSYLRRVAFADFHVLRRGDVAHRAVGIDLIHNHGTAGL